MGHKPPKHNSKCQVSKSAPVFGFQVWNQVSKVRVESKLEPEQAVALARPPEAAPGAALLRGFRESHELIISPVWHAY